MSSYHRGLSHCTFAALAAGLLGISVRAQQAPPVPDGQRLAMYAKPAVVLIQDGFKAEFVNKETSQRVPILAAASGSGFFINADGYVATNAHVTSSTREYDAKKEEYAFGELYSQLCTTLQPRGACEVGNRDFSRVVAAFQIDPKSFVHYHQVIIPDGTVYPFEIKSFGRPIGTGSEGEGKDVAIIKIEVRNAPTLKISEAGAPELQDHVTVFGYPDAAESEILNRRSSLEVSITDGRISARKAMSDAAPVLQISAPATHGNSGGPVMNDKGEVVGLLTFGGNREVSGFGFAIPSTTVMEFVRTAGAGNTQSDVDTRYHEGLELFWAGQYRPAIQKFEEVRRLFPQHSEVTNLIQRSEELGGRPGPPPPPASSGIPPWAWVVLGAAGLGLLAWLAMRRKTPALASQPATASQRPAAAGQGTGAYRPSENAPRVTSANQSSVLLDDADAATVRVGAKPATLGSLTSVGGPLLGQRFDLRPEGIYIGRDAALSQIVIDDHRVSKRHVWVGPRNGRMVAVDQASMNGTFVNHPGGESIKEAVLSSGDTIIVAEPEVGQFIFKR